MSTDITLVPLDRVHLARTLAWTNDPEIARLMDRATPVSPPEHEAWFASIVGRDDCLYFAVHEADGDEPRHVGNVWLWAIDRRHRKAEVRVVIGDPDARDRGVGRRALDLLCRHAFDSLQLHRVYAYVLAINPRARRAFEGAGFTLEGTLCEDRVAGDGFTDVYVLGRLNRR